MNLLSHPSTATVIEPATTMESRKILWCILGIYLVIIAEIAIVRGAAVDTTTESLVSESPIVPEEIIEIEPQTTTTTATTTTANECICNCENQESVANCPEEIQTVTDVNEHSPSATASEVDVGNNAVTDQPNVESEPQPSTSNNDDKISPEIADATTNDTDAPRDSRSPTAVAPLCSTPGLQAHETDCHAYYNCSSAESSDGSFRLLTKFCAPNLAFNVEFGVCGRDISSCPNDVVCSVKGGVADPISNTSYYLCDPRLIGGGFRLYHVQCSENQIFYPAVGKCFLDYSNLNQQPNPTFPPFNWNQIEDIDIVKTEMQVVREHEKIKLKLEKEQMKAERKLQKEAAKEAERIAKEQEKLLKDQIKLESETFMCQQEGNFPSTVSDTVYFSCTVKKTKFKKTLMKCPLGSKFNGASGLCVSDGSVNNVVKPDDNEEDDD